MMKIAVAMSGGVDSSVAALLLKRQGYEVAGFHMNLFPEIMGEQPAEGACCSEESSLAARSVCDRLGIVFYCLDFQGVFRESVIQPFVESYANGRTPNPCVECNRRVKFGALLDDVTELGFDAMATGHYARKLHVDDKWHLIKGADRGKDQSYFLYMLSCKLLEKIEFPNGEYQKSEIRKIAVESGLPVADRPESQEICFAGKDSYVKTIEKTAGDLMRPGPIVDMTGNRLGEHRGIVHYTIGQRRGLGISAPEPLYVVEINPDKNTVVVGHDDDLFVRGLSFTDASFVDEPPEAGVEVEVKIRYNAAPARAEYKGAIATDNGVVEHRLFFKSAQRAVAPGQAVVLYSGDRVIGGGTIRWSLSE
jgi:tRNA-uridine 2-sulfurtransferase